MVVALPEGESLTIKHRALVAHSAGITFENCPDSGLADGVRRALAGSSFQVRRLTSSDDGAWAEIAGPGEHPTSVVPVDLSGEVGLTIADGAWLANTSGVEVDAAWKGAEATMARERAVMSHATGEGTVVLYSGGSITSLELEDGQEIHLGQGRLLAYTDGINLDANRIAGRTVITATGVGTVFYSSHSETS